MSQVTLQITMNCSNATKSTIWSHYQCSTPLHLEFFTCPRCANLWNGVRNSVTNKEALLTIGYPLPLGRYTSPQRASRTVRSEAHIEYLENMIRSQNEQSFTSHVSMIHAKSYFKTRHFPMLQPGYNPSADELIRRLPYNKRDDVPTPVIDKGQAHYESEFIKRLIIHYKRHHSANDTIIDIHVTMMILGNGETGHTDIPTVCFITNGGSKIYI
jgi:hypothetical protein